MNNLKKIAEKRMGDETNIISPKNQLTTKLTAKAAKIAKHWVGKFNNGVRTF